MHATLHCLDFLQEASNMDSFVLRDQVQMLFLSSENEQKATICGGLTVCLGL